MKNYFLNFLLVILSIGFFYTSYGQDNSILLEKLEITVNNDQFITGENIYYKVIVKPQNASENISSKIVYVALIDSNFTVIKKQKYAVDSQTCKGDLFIPTSYKTGNYKLIAYTNQSILQDITTNAVKNIVIINPYTELTPYIDIKKQSKTFENKDESKFVSKTNFKSREKVTINNNYFSNKNLKTESVSVKKMNDYFGLTNTNQLASNTKENISKYNTPELRGEILKGKIKRKDDTNTALSVQEVGITLSIPAIQNFTFKNTKTNEKGEFYFILDQNTYLEDVYLQIKEPFTSDFEIVIQNPEIDFSFLKFNQKISINAQQLENIKKSAIASQIENAYFELKKDTLKNTETTMPFYGNLATVYNLREYKQFNSIKEIIFEVLPNVYTKEIKGKRKIYLRDESNKAQSSDCLVLINGFYVEDIDAFFEFNGREIEKVAFVTQQYAYGPFIYKGIINFITQKEIPEYYLKENVTAIKFERTVQPKFYYNQSYDTTVDYSKIPDYRTFLTWQTQFDKPETTFYTSDIKGWFEVKIDALDKNGNIVTEYDYFEVN